MHVCTLAPMHLVHPEALVNESTFRGTMSADLSARGSRGRLGGTHGEEDCALEASGTIEREDRTARREEIDGAQEQADEDEEVREESRAQTGEEGSTAASACAEADGARSGLHSTDGRSWHHRRRAGFERIVTGAPGAISCQTR